MTVAPSYRATKTGAELFVRGTANASTNKINGLALDVNGRTYLKIYVTAVPEHNKANEAIVGLLAQRFNVAASYITQTAGQSHRYKIFHLDGISVDEIADSLKNESLGR